LLMERAQKKEEQVSHSTGAEESAQKRTKTVWSRRDSLSARRAQWPKKKKSTPTSKSSKIVIRNMHADLPWKPHSTGDHEKPADRQRAGSRVRTGGRPQVCSQAVLPSWEIAFQECRRHSPRSMGVCSRSALPNANTWYASAGCEEWEHGIFRCSFVLNTCALCCTLSYLLACVPVCADRFWIS
jgi:hypothetical protein